MLLGVAIIIFKERKTSGSEEENQTDVYKEDAAGINKQDAKTDFIEVEAENTNNEEAGDTGVSASDLDNQKRKTRKRRLH